MSVSYNKTILLGRTTDDAELRFTKSNSPVCQVTLAVDNSFKKSTEEKVEDTLFIDVTFWGRLAEVVGEYVTKGTLILVDGRLKLDKWEKDGVKRSKISLTASNMQLVESRKDRDSRKPDSHDSEEPKSTFPQPGDAPELDQVPF
jgi:single-strand DNA-binding protein